MMKLIIGVYDRILSRKLAVVLSSKKILPIEAESMEEIPQLLHLHPEAMVLCEETAPAFYQQIMNEGFNPDIYLIFHPSMSNDDIFLLKNMGIKALLPYTEDPDELIEKLIHQLSLLARSIRPNNTLYQVTQEQEHNVAIHLPEVNRWFYGLLHGFNSSKVSIQIDKKESQFNLLEHYQTNNITIMLQSLKIKCTVDLVNVKDNYYIFRFRSMTKENADRLAYYINYCQQNQLNKVNS